MAPTDEQQTSSTLARVDERTKAIQDDLLRLREDIRSTVAGLSTAIRDSESRVERQVRELEIKLDDTQKELEEKFVSQESFWPIRMIVYGLVGIVLTGVLTAVLALVVVNVSKGATPKPVAAIELPLGHQ